MCAKECINIKKFQIHFRFCIYRIPTKSNLSYLKCVVLVRPTSENIRLLSKEITSPRYGSYYIFFTNKVKRADLKTLAENDSSEVVKDIREVPSDFLVFEPHVYTVKVSIPIKNLRWNKSTMALGRCADSLKALLVALKGSRANICYVKDSSVCEELAHGIKDEIVHDGPRDTLLVLMDRRTDP